MCDNILEKMQESVENDTVAFNKFLLEYDKYTNTSFYFVEGEDFCYYNSRIKRFLNDKETRHYRCNSKKNVIGVRNLIKKAKIEIDESDVMLFFVDKDFGFDTIPDDIYATEWYSIENFYLTRNLIKNVLENNFELYKEEKNYILAIEYFEKLYKEYSKFARKLNVFYYTVRECEKIQGKKRTNFNKIQFWEFIEKNRLDNFKMQEISYDELLQFYEITCELDYELLKKNEYLFFEDRHYNFRGKFELEFLKFFLKSIRTAMKNGSYGFEKMKVCQYDFQADTMKILTEYAYTPKDLKEYIESSENAEKEMVKIS